MSAVVLLCMVSWYDTCMAQTTSPSPNIPAPGDDHLPAPSPSDAPSPSPFGDDFVEMPSGDSAQCERTEETPTEKGFENCGYLIRNFGAEGAACDCNSDCYGDSCCDDYGKRPFNIPRC